jgi:pimeloyl-ACP methyl ester carboxylesterase
MSGVAQRYPERLVSQIARSMAKVDRELLSREEVREPFLADIAEGLRPGGKGYAHEAALLAGAWGFRLDEITMPVHLWQGEADRTVPAAMGRALARGIPECKATFVPGAGHLWIVDHAGEVLGALTG